MTKLVDLIVVIVIPSIILNFMASCDAATTPTSTAPKKAICFFANWAQYRRGAGRFLPGHIEPHLCTHITYAHLMVDLVTHRLVQRQKNDHILLAGINALKKINPALKVIISVGK